jgi:hypothetical protein
MDSWSCWSDGGAGGSGGGLRGAIVQEREHQMIWCVCAEIKSPFSERSLREEFRESKIIHCLFPIIDTIIYTITGFNNFLQIRI